MTKLVTWTNTKSKIIKVCFFFSLCCSYLAHQRTSNRSDLFLPSSPAPLHEPGHPRRAPALLPSQLPLHWHGQLHADSQHRPSRQLWHRGLKQKAPDSNGVVNVFLRCHAHYALNTDFYSPDLYGCDVYMLVNLKICVDLSFFSSCDRCCNYCSAYSESKLLQGKQ